MKKCKGCEEQARLLSMSGEREYSLLGKLERAKRYSLKWVIENDSLMERNFLDGWEKEVINGKK